jgi:hypothetical protein
MENAPIFGAFFLDSKIKKAVRMAFERLLTKKLKKYYAIKTDSDVSIFNSIMHDFII